jgi:glycosyltransferase involved in cell wall biosynthesis
VELGRLGWHRVSGPRILMLLHDYYPEEVRVVAEARAAVAAGFAVDVLALRGDGEVAEELMDGVRVLRLPVAHRHGASGASLLREYLAFTVRAGIRAGSLSLRERYDVVEVHNPPDFLVVAALLPRLLGAKVVLDIHDLTPDMAMMRFGNKPGGWLDKTLRLLERWAAKASDAVLTVHEPYRQELAEHGVPLEKITVVMNSLDESVLPSELEPDARLDGFEVVYHGTITPHYGVGLLIEAAALARRSVPDLRVAIYGAGDAVPDVLARTRALGLDAAVELVPRFLPHADVLLAVRSASVGAIPNLSTRLNRFALPTKLFEYVALGIPVVTADLRTIREHFSDAEVWFFEPGSAESMADAIARVAADPEAAATRAEAARRRYEEYRWPHSARAYTILMSELAGRRRRGRAADGLPSGA